MSVRALLAAVAVVSVPIAVQGAEPQSAQQRVNAQNRRVCTTHAEPGSRIKSVRTCRTAAEIEEARREQRHVIDKIQTNKTSSGR
jgi:hypothetical protein